MGNLLQPEPTERLKPSVMERTALVADIHVEYPYAGNDRCVLCPNLLSRYNPHVVCNVCFDRVRNEVWRSGDKALKELLESRRVRNRKFHRPTNINVKLLTSVGTDGYRVRKHHAPS